MSDKNEYTCKGVRCCCQSRLQEVLQKYFSFSSFRPGQMEASRSVLHGKDVFVRMATGSGKTLCMFLGPLAKSDKALGVVISPLNGLMEQQVRYFYVNNMGSIHLLLMNRYKTSKRLALLLFTLGLIVQLCMNQCQLESTDLVGLG